MIVNERLTAYIDSLDQGYPSYLQQIEREARAASIPIIRKETQSFLRMALSMGRPQSILEVGTAVGFSALLMCEYAPRDCQITTIENYGPRVKTARENFRRYGREGQIHLLEGDAGGLLSALEGPYDLIFLDAAKGQYIHWLPDMVRLLLPGGMLLSDNVLQDGDIIESRFLVERRDRTIHKRMREYLYALTHHPELYTSVLPIGDGLAVSVKDRENGGRIGRDQKEETGTAHTSQ